MNSRRAYKTALFALAAQVLLGALVFLFLRSDTADFKRDAEVLALLRELKEIVMRWDADAERLSGSLAVPEVPLERSGTLGRVLRELERAEGREVLNAAMPEIRRGIDEKAALWEEVKSRHARSLAALAEAREAAAALVTAARAMRLRDPAKGERYAVLAVEVEALAQIVGSPGVPADGPLLARLATLGEAAASASPVLAGPGAVAGKAFDTFLEVRAAERATVQRFIFLPAGAKVDLLWNDLTHGVQDSLAERQRWRIYLFFYAAALLVGVAWLSARVFAAQAALREANEGLERRVAERTRELSEALASLKESEAALVQSEKMSSLGQMVAGVAHEINTPLAYVKNSVATVRDRLPELEESVALSEQLVRLLQSPDTGAAELQKVFEATSARLAQLREHEVLGDLEALSGDGLHGIEQIAELVANLRDFSRLDRSKVASFDVNEAVSATLSIAKHLLKDIAVERRLGEVPPIMCSPSQVNQVLLNLLTNAAQALDKPDKRIVVTTRREGNDAVAIEVADNGTGIPPDVLPRIFDPFFTTKDVGKGTGLGLSVSYKIVKQHGGRLDVKSRPGEGTAFTVVLPLHPPEEAEAAQT